MSERNKNLIFKLQVMANRIDPENPDCDYAVSQMELRDLMNDAARALSRRTPKPPRHPHPKAMA